MAVDPERKKVSTQAKAPVVDRGVARRLLALARPHRWRFVAAAGCLLVSTVSFLALPYTIRLLTDSVFLHHDATQLNVITGILMAVVLASAVFGYGRGYLLAYVGGRIVADLRISLYRHLQSLSLSFYDEHRVGDLMSRLTSDTTLVQTVLTDNLMSLLQQTVTLIAVMAIVLLLDWRLALVTLLLAPLMAVVGTVVGRRTRHLSTRAQEQLGEASVVLEETLSAMRIVKAFNRGAHEITRYSSSVDRSFTIGLAAARLRALFESIMLTAAFASIAGVLWFGGHEVLAGRLTPGGLISFLFYLTILIGPLQALSSLYGEFQLAAGSAARIFEILDVEPTIVDAAGAVPLPPVEGHLDICDLSFAYRFDGPEVLRDVNFCVAPGETVALVGPSGAGKTTLVSLLPRFYEPNKGCILIDGHDISTVTIESLRAAIAIVPQESTLFGGTVRENIAYGRIGASQADVETAARLANAHAFIVALADGYDSVVGERGVKLSGGQRQRIAIARAVLKNPRILILDEATSALDNESEALVQDALDRLMEDRTSLVIAHRLTTVERADRIVVLDDGRVIEQGSHDELLAREGLYYRLYTRAFAEEKPVAV